MDWDLWSSPFDQVVSDDSYSDSEYPEWQYIYFGREHDLIEEDALNVASCIQVLRILITNADTEIEGLEKDLLSLQNELAWAEHEKWPEICCSALTERINLLDVAISTLKNDHADDTEVQLLLHNKPAETLNEIVEALQRDHCQNTIGQQLDVNTLKPIVNDTEHALDKDCSSVDSNIIIKEEGNELYGTSENFKGSEFLLELHEKRSSAAENIEESLAKSPVASPNLGAICCAPDHSDGMKLSGTSDNQLTENEEVGRSQLITTYTGQIVNLISSKGNGNIPREVKESHAKSPVASPDLGAICCAPDHSDEMKLSGTSDNKVTENEEVRRSQLITTYTGQIVNLVSSKGNGNIPIEVKKENAIDKEKDVISDDLRFESGVKGRENCLHSRLHASQHKKSGNSDLDKKLCDFALKTARRACKKEFKVAPAEDLDSMKLPLQVVYPQELCVADTELCSFKGSDDDHSQKMMSIENTCLINAENSASISLLEMQTKSAPYTGLQLTDEEKQAQGLKSKSAANLSRSNMSPPSKLKASGKRKAELEPFSSREPLDSPTEVDPITSIVVSTKRQRKSKTSTGTVSFNESMISRIMKSAVQPGREETEDRAIVPYDSEFSELQKKMRVSKFPITTETQNSAVNLDIPYSDKVSIDNGSQVDVDICKSCSLEGSHETSTSLSNSLKSLTLHSLRALAKQHNVQKYYKLTKGLLIEQLVARLGNC